ncbi:MAG: AfsR/SARP family transcriptional regulator, partial [Acidimicrobiia bacterium]
MPPTLDVRLLGPLEVRVDGEVIDLGPPRHRALIALLALTPNRVVSTDRILEALWGEEADSKEKALWVYVSRLRSALEPDRSERGESSLLVRRDPGYLLAVEPGDVDVVRFEEAVAEARTLGETDPEAALGVVDDALGLWRGDALEEFRYEDFAAGEIRRLEELRLEALEIRFEVSLGLGRDRELVGQLEQLAREHPYREGITRALMIALYRSGRQAEALRALERHARTIGEELGLEPSPELRTLEEQVLLQDDSLRRAEELVVQADNPYRGLRAFGEDHAADFHGRGRLTAEILRRLERRDGLVAVVGASGSGKSSVVRAG